MLGTGVGYNTPEMLQIWKNTDMSKMLRKHPDHTEEESSNKKKCPNCRQDHPADAKSSDIVKKEKEIVKH